MDGPRNFDDSDFEVDIKIDKETPIKEEKKSSSGGGCPKQYRCAWKFETEGEKFEGKTDWMCHCRAMEIAKAGVAQFGEGSHWVEKKKEE